MDSKVIKETLQCIYNLIKYTMKYFIEYRLPIEVLEKRKKFSSIASLCDDLLTKTEERDKAFMSEFVRTQMYLTTFLCKDRELKGVN